MSSARSSSSILAAASAALLMTGCGGHGGFSLFDSPGVKGSGVAKTETREVGDFTELDVSAAMNVELTVGPETKFEITADDNLLEHLKSEVSNGKLKVHFDTSTSSKIGVKIKATTPSLKAYHGSGATTAKIEGVKAESFKIDLSGASNCTVVGTADKLVVECSGASNVKADKLVAKTVKARASGASSIEANATEEVNAHASGASSIRYSGKPSSGKFDASGASSIKAKD
jgi:hypothetical protein